MVLWYWDREDPRLPCSLHCTSKGWATKNLTMASKFWQSVLESTTGPVGGLLDRFDKCSIIFVGHWSDFHCSSLVLFANDGNALHIDECVPFRSRLQKRDSWWKERCQREFCLSAESRLIIIFWESFSESRIRSLPRREWPLLRFFRWLWSHFRPRNVLATNRMILLSISKLCRIMYYEYCTIVLIPKRRTEHIENIWLSLCLFVVTDEKCKSSLVIRALARQESLEHFPVLVVAVLGKTSSLRIRSLASAAFLALRDNQRFLLHIQRLPKSCLFLLTSNCTSSNTLPTLIY